MDSRPCSSQLSARHFKCCKQVRCDELNARIAWRRVLHGVLRGVGEILRCTRAPPVLFIVFASCYTSDACFLACFSCPTSAPCTLDVGVMGRITVAGLVHVLSKAMVHLPWGVTGLEAPTLGMLTLLTC